MRLAVQSEQIETFFLLQRAFSGNLTAKWRELTWLNSWQNGQQTKIPGTNAELDVNSTGAYWPASSDRGRKRGGFSRGEVQCLS